MSQYRSLDLPPTYQSASIKGLFNFLHMVYSIVADKVSYVTLVLSFFAGQRSCRKVEDGKSVKVSSRTASLLVTVFQGSDEPAKALGLH